MVSVWDLMVVMSAGSAYGGAIAAGRIDGGGPVRSVVAALLGALTGAFCTVVHFRVGRRLLALPNLRRGQLRLIYFGAMVWVGVSAALGAVVTLGVMRLAMP